MLPSFPSIVVVSSNNTVVVVPSGISVVIVVSTLIVDVILGSSVAGSPLRGCKTFQSGTFYPKASISDFSTINSKNMTFSFMN